MDERQKQSIIESGKQYFREIIIPKHLNNLQSLKLKDFKVNPFLVNYLAAFLCGNTEPRSLAKAFGEVVEEGDTEGKCMVLQMVNSLAEDIKSYIDMYGVKTA